jgi:hypothetical protein
MRNVQIEVEFELGKNLLVEGEVLPDSRLASSSCIALAGCNYKTITRERVLSR